MPEWNLLSIKINDQPDEWSENMTDQERITYWSTECVKVKAALAKLEIQTEIERRAMKRESGEESGWVIELAASEPCSPQYWAGSSLWVPEHLKALRFARKQDAQQAADFMLDGMKIRICEHGWS